MAELADETLASILSHLDVPSIISFSSTCKRFPRLVRDAPAVQLTLHHHWHGTSPAVDDVEGKSTWEKIIALQDLKTNLRALRPTITEIDIPKGHDVHAVWGEYIITRPSYQADKYGLAESAAARAGEAATSTDDGSSVSSDEEVCWSLVCSILHKGTRRDVTVDFNISDTFAVDITQDILIFRRWEADELSETIDNRLDVCHLFNPTELPVEYIEGGVLIEDDKWPGWDEDGYPRLRLQILSRGRFVIEYLQVFVLFDIGANEKLGVFEEQSWNCKYFRFHGRTMSTNDVFCCIMEALDRTDTLALLSLENFPLSSEHSCSFDLLLKLPNSTQLRSFSLLPTLDGSSNVYPSTHYEIIGSNSHISWMRAASIDRANVPSRYQLCFGIESKSFRTLLMEQKDRETRPAYSDQVPSAHNHPAFENDAIPFIEWSPRALLSTGSSSRSIQQPAENGHCLVQYERNRLRERGGLTLTLEEFEPFNKRGPSEESGQWGCLNGPHSSHGGNSGEVEVKGGTTCATAPNNYTNLSYAQASAPGLALPYNYSLWSIPVGWVVAQMPLWWSIYAAETTSRGTYDNANPKDSWERMKNNKDISPQLRGRITRAISADINSHINLPLFAAALGTANAARVDTPTLHLYSAIYLASRVAYSFAYILINKRKYSFIRSTLYGFGVLATLTLFVKAGAQFNKIE